MMATATKRTERLLNLFTFLLNSRQPQSAVDIRKTIPHYQVSRSGVSFKRTLGRDVQALRQLGVPLEVDVEGGYRIVPKAYHLPLLEFSEGELNGLALAWRIVSTLEPPLPEAAESALRKLSFGNWESLRQAEEKEADLEFQLLRRRGGLSPEALETLLDAILNRRTLRIRYWARTSRQTTERDVDPYGLLIHDGQWYLVGFCHLRLSIRVFKGIRIKKLQISPLSRQQGGDFDVPNNFNLRDHFAFPRWRQRKSGVPLAVKVWFDSEVWWWIKDNWGPFGTVQDEPGGGVLNVQVQDADAFVEAMLEFGLHAEVKEPQSLRLQMVRVLERIMEVHN
jgi:proteasome accessory factor B